MTALLLAAAFACGAALPAMAEQATPETAAQPDPTEWADEAQDYIEYLEKAVGCKIKYISVGPERDACIIRD